MQAQLDADGDEGTVRVRGNSDNELHHRAFLYCVRRVVATTVSVPVPVRAGSKRLPRQLFPFLFSSRRRRQAEARGWVQCVQVEVDHLQVAAHLRRR